MKSINLLFICLWSTVSFAQKTPQELTTQMLKTCADNDVQAYKKLCPNVEELTAFIKSLDTKGTYNYDTVNAAYLRGINTAVASFSDFQDSLEEDGIKLKEIKITDTKIEDEEVDFSEGGEVAGIAKIKKVTVFFTSGAKKYNVLLPRMVEINGKWRSTEEPFELTEL